MSSYRHEYKYLLDSKMEQILLIRAGGLLSLDSHVQQEGSYYIRSLYFDDYGDSCLMENEAGTDPRSKFRIRYYNRDIGRIRLEKKSKTRGMTRKESCSITEDECRAFMEGNVPDVTEDMPPVKKALFLEMRMRSLIPKVIVSYDRIPFVYPGGNVRITFDKHIASSVQISEFLSGSYISRSVLPRGRCILEVKWDEVLPLHIRNVMEFDRLQWTAFSKYYMCRKYHL